MKSILPLLLSAVLFTACESELTINPGTTLTIDNPSSSLVIDDEGISTFTFTSSAEWAVSVTDTAKIEWFTLSQMDGASGENSITITAKPNNTFADRKAHITLKSGFSEFTVGIFQEFGNGVTDIPFVDRYFKQYCLENFDTNKDGLLSFAEVRKVVSLNTSYMYNIRSLRGIEYFTGLEEFACRGNDLFELDLSKNTKLKNLSCTNSRIEKIDLSKNTELSYLHIADNSLLNLDLSKNTKLQQLNCSSTNIETLDLSKNIELREINGSNSKLKELDFSNNKKLTKVICNSISTLTSLKISDSPQLTVLECNNNKLSTLDVRKCAKLAYLDCQYNQLSSLNLRTNNSISSIYSRGNPYLKEIQLNANNNEKPYISKDSHTEIKYIFAIVVDPK